MSLLQNVERIVVPVLFSNTPAHTDGKLPPEAQIGKKRKRKTIFSKYHLNILEHGTCSFINIYEELSCVWCREGIIFFFFVIPKETPAHKRNFKNPEKYREGKISSHKSTILVYNFGIFPVWGSV